MARAPAAVFGSLLCLLVAGCASASDDPNTVVVGLLPVPDLVALRLGEAKGFFAEQGIKVRFIDVPRGDAAVSALLSNTVHFANVDVVTGLIAREQQLPIQWVTTVHSSPDRADVAFQGVYVRPDSPIRRWADLAGRKVNTSCRKCGSELYLRGAVDRNGGDSARIQLVTMPTAQAVPALGRGQLDAASVSPGLVPKAEAAGFRKIGDPIAETALGHPLGPIAVNTVWADSHPRQLKAFIRAAEKSTIYAAEHPAEARAAMPRYFPQIVPDRQAAARVPLAAWSRCFQMDAIRSIADYTLRYGFTHTPVARLSDLFYSGHAIAPRTCRSPIPPRGS
ncbi:ABC transporter substrate-binding protein [Sphingomonas sp.]|uniref:ABC transporter substrate-binding protein n=1 Tax=Sphingomonas sp. TaxID=28214 RepID=UPI002ED91A49